MSTETGQAQALLKMSTTQLAISEAEQSTNDTILWGTNGRASGVAFESTTDGIVVVRRIQDYSDTIALTIAGHPRIDDPIILVAILGAMDLQPKQTDAHISAMLDPSSTRLLQQRLTRLPTDRAHRQY